LVLAALALAAPAAAELFTITLNSGHSFESRYEPMAASWNPELVMFMTDQGNWIALPRADVASIEAETEARGFGMVINTTTIDLGYAPQIAGEEIPVDPYQQYLEALRQEQPYSVQQFVEPSQAQGIPGSFIGFPSGGPAAFPGVQAPFVPALPPPVQAPPAGTAPVAPTQPAPTPPQ
jgi:hypothetical protein